MTFDYNDTEVSDDVVRAVSQEMAGGTLPPLTDEDLAEREVWRAYLRQRDHEMQLERERARAAKQEAANQLARAEHKRAMDERAKATIERIRERQSADLERRVRQQELWQQSAEQAAYNAARQHYRQTLMAELDAMINPPQPQPEPEPTVIVEQEEDSGSVTLHRWFVR